MIKKIQNFCFKNKLFSPDQSLVVGFSGGPDSTALVCFLNSLKKSWRLKIQLVHINYCLRGEDSKKDEEFCLQLAEEFSLPIKVVPYQEEKKTSANLEERLRDFRYAVFEKERKEKNFDWIVVGHTLDDGAETFLFNLMRGAGLKGLSSLKPKNGRIIRPFLGLEKKELLAFLKKQKQTFRLDKSNQELKFTRNRIRKNLLPFLEKEYNPKIKERLADLQEHLSDVEDWLEKETEKTFQSLAKKQKTGWKIDVQEYLSLPRALRKNLFRLIIKRLQGSLRNVSAGSFWELEKVAFSQKSKRQTICLGKIKISKKLKELFFDC